MIKCEKYDYPSPKNCSNCENMSGGLTYFVLSKHYIPEFNNILQWIPLKTLYKMRNKLDHEIKDKELGIKFKKNWEDKCKAMEE